MLAGSVYAVRKLALPWRGTGSGSSGGEQPWARPSVCGNWNRVGASATSGDGLATQALAEEPWPRPDATAANSGETVESWDARRERVRARGINGNGMGEPLGIAVQREEPAATWPRPTAADGGRGSMTYGHGEANPTLLGAVLRAEEGSWPRPTATDGKAGTIHGTGSPTLLGAAREAEGSWPRPTCSDSTGGHCPEEKKPAILGATLNPAWVEILLGWPLGLVSGLPWTEHGREVAARRREARRSTPGSPPGSSPE
jgi:hypothetical protein